MTGNGGLLQNHTFVRPLREAADDVDAASGVAYGSTHHRTQNVLQHFVSQVSDFKHKWSTIQEVFL